MQVSCETDLEQHQHGYFICMWSTVGPAASGADAKGVEPDYLGTCKTILAAMRWTCF